MHKTMVLGIAAGVALIGVAKADPVDLSAYADANGFIDVQTLTCAQLANTYQEEAYPAVPGGPRCGMRA